MSRSVAAAAGTVVSIGVFAWLANPLLATYFGTEALLATYATFAVAAGILTFVLLRRLDHRLASASSSASTEDPTGAAVTVELDHEDVEAELDQLREE